MADPNHIGGVGSIKVDGRQLSVRGTFTISPNEETRTGVGGPDGTHGYTSENHVPFIEAEISNRPQFFTMEQLRAIVNSTVVASLGNGEVWTLRNSWLAGDLELDALAGTLTVRFEGLQCYRN
jgi:Phage tail tube protein